MMRCLLTDKKRIKEEIVKETVTCKVNEESEELPQLPITISKSKCSQKLLIYRLIDTGTSTSIISYQMVKELKMEIRSGDHITLKMAKRWI